MDVSCSKDVRSSSELSKHFTESDESVYSETSETSSDSYHSDEYYDIPWDLSASMDVQNQNNDDQWIQIADRASDIILTAITFSPVNTAGPVDCVSKDCKPNDFFFIFILGRILGP